MNNIEIFGVPYLKKGSGIHIKEENKGKFTASAKAAGQSVQEHAKSVLNNPNATPLQKKRANFARNAKKWKHKEGSKIHKPNGHRSILDNGWQSTKELKKKRPLIAINADGGLVSERTKKPIDKKSLLTNEFKKKLAIKRLVNPTGFVNKRPVPGMLARKQKGGIFKYLGGTPEGGIVIAERDNTYVQPFLVSLVMPRYKPEPEPVVDNRSEAHKKYLETFYRLGGEDLSSRSNKARTNEANKYTIPYIPEKEIRLTTDRYNTGKISTNLLDSIYNASLRTGVPFDIALGLAGRESTLGIGRGFKRGSAISGTNLYSNWLLILPIIISNKTADKATELFKRIRQGEILTDEEYNFLTKYFENRQKELDSTKAMKENPIDNALKYYMLGKYNPGDKKHTLMVEKDARILMTDPAIRKWMLEKGMI